jgi:hypothetical protein
VSHEGIAFISVLCVLTLAAVHVFVGKLRFLEGPPRSAYLSIAGGVSVAYVFVHLLPELAEDQKVIAASFRGALATVQHHIYVLALIGLALFYGVEHLVDRSDAVKGSGPRSHADAARGSETATPAGGETTTIGAFRLHLASFGLYNLLIGYLLLHRIARGLPSLILFSIAMALHFLVTDHGLHERHRCNYERLGRWVLVAAVLVGWLIALFTTISDAWIAMLVAILAGGIILNVLKQELPKEQRSRFWAFGTGAFAYTAILLTL